MPDGTARPGRPATRPAPERPIVLWGGAALFLVGWATVSLTNAAETLFLKRVGVEQLPAVFLLNSGLLAASTYVVGRWVATADHGRALLRTLWAAAVFLVPLWVGLVFAVPGVLPVLVIAAKQIQAIALLVFWVAMGGWVDGRQAKRLVPPMMAGGTSGVAFGSFASSQLGAALGIPALVWIAAAALGLSALAAQMLRRHTVVRIEWPLRPNRDDTERPTMADLWRDSGLFRLLATCALLAGTLAPVLYYLFSAAADAATHGRHGEQELLALYGNVRGWMNVAIVALQLGGTSWLFRRVGVPRAALLSPVVYVLGFIGFAFSGSLGIAIAAMAAATLQDKALGEPAERTLATLFPERIRPTVAALLDGILKRSGGVLGNILVLATIGLSFEAMLPALAIPPALAWLVAAAALARVYPGLLLEAATQTRFGRGDAPDADLLDARTIRLLEASLQDPDPERCAAACDLVLDAPPGVAVSVAATALRDAPSGNVPVLLDTITTLVHTGTLDDAGGTSARMALVDAATGRTDLPVDTTARLVLLASSLGTIGNERRAALAELASNPDAPSAVRLAARLALDPSEAESPLAAAVAADDTETRRVALEALRASLLRTDPSGPSRETWQREIDLVVPRLSDDSLRADAAATLADLAERHGAAVGNVVAPFSLHREHEDVHVRAALLRFFGYAGRTEEAPWAISRLSSPDPEEVAAAQAALCALGTDVLDVILEGFHCDCRHTRTALLPVLHEVGVPRPTLQALIDRELAGIRHVLDLERELAGATTSGLVRQRLAERVDEGTRAAVSLFAALHRDPRIAELGPLLERVRGGRERAVLLEALEALLPAGQANALVRILDRTPRAQTTESSDDARGAALRRALRDDDSLTRAFVAATIDAAELERLGGMRPISEQEPAHALTPIRPIRSQNGAQTLEENPAMLSGVEIVLHLRSLTLFERLTTRELTELAGIVRELSHPAATRIVTEGDFDDCMYLIVSGKVEITRDGVRLREFGPRDFFGEMAILDGETRSATVTSLSRVRLLRIDRPDLLRVMDDRPGIAIAICQTLSRRVRELNDTLRDLQQQTTAASPEANGRVSPS